MADEVIPFGRGRRRGKQGAPTPPQPIPNRARDVAARQGRQRLEGYQKALAPQREARNRAEEERLLRDEKPIPARITMALDMSGLWGPEVDAACGVAEPMVDLWECAVEVPTPEQVKLLAKLTGFPVAYFYRPIPAELRNPEGGRGWICSRGKCEPMAADFVDERGVLHYGGEPPRTPPHATQGTLF